MKNITKKAITTYRKCLPRYCNGEPPSIFTRIGTKLYTVTKENAISNMVIIQITGSPLRYFRYSLMLFESIE
jgi:hypothetical protein